MRRIDIETWPRREHFRVFDAMDYPHFSLCANVDVTALHAAAKQRGVSFTVAVTYLVARAANAHPAFRYRIRGGEVVEHEVVHPSATLLRDDELFTFCTIPFAEPFAAFAEQAAACIAHVREHPTLEDEPGQDDLLFMTSIPWVSFTSFMHPIHLHPVDSVPRFAWGKFFEEGAALKMPLSVQAHHGLMDGVHMGRFFATVQDYLHQADDLLGVPQVETMPSQG